MAGKIFVKPEQAWDYFLERGKDTAVDKIKLAEDLDYGIEIFATPYWEIFTVNVDVYINGYLEDRDWSTSRAGYIFVTNMIFDLYLGFY